VFRLQGAEEVFIFFKFFANLTGPRKQAFWTGSRKQAFWELLYTKKTQNVYKTLQKYFGKCVYNWHLREGHYKTGAWQSFMICSTEFWVTKLQKCVYWPTMDAAGCRNCDLHLQYSKKNKTSRQTFLNG
jgi:hypothetical protein